MIDSYETVSCICESDRAPSTLIKDLSLLFVASSLAGNVYSESGRRFVVISDGGSLVLVALNLTA